MPNAASHSGPCSSLQSATWAAESFEEIPQRTIVRSFVACRITHPEDYSDSERRDFGLDSLVHMGFVRAVAEVVDDDDELKAQLEQMPEEEEWLFDEATPHFEEQHEEAEEWEHEQPCAEAGESSKAKAKAKPTAAETGEEPEEGEEEGGARGRGGRRARRRKRWTGLSLRWERRR